VLQAEHATHCVCHGHQDHYDDNDDAQRTLGEEQTAVDDVKYAQKWRGSCGGCGSSHTALLLAELLHARDERLVGDLPG
jgi:hypothetical protein